MNVYCEKSQFGVTLANRIDPEVIGSIYVEKHVMVLDIRTGDDPSKPKGIKEATLRKLQNYQIQYEQMPIDFTHSNARQNNELLRVICEQAGNVLVLSNQSAEMMAFCHDCHIPVQAKKLVLVYSNEKTSRPQLVEAKKSIRA